MTSQDLLSFLASGLVAILDAVTCVHGASSLRIITEFLQYRASNISVYTSLRYNMSSVVDRAQCDLRVSACTKQFDCFATEWVALKIK
ncbi:hypothetical protein V1477_008491 [Vespula maculifrons]|uniref:Secreted protein n=1 Tax=Vespula maculifrons TaxID=7453 RepID=A0ABD2CD65_VESMC